MRIFFPKYIIELQIDSFQWIETTNNNNNNNKSYETKDWIHFRDFETNKNDWNFWYKFVVSFQRFWKGLQVLSPSFGKGSDLSVINSMYGWMWAAGIWFLVLCVMLSKPLNLNKSFCDRALLSHCSPFDVFFSTTSPLHNTHYILMSFSPFSSDSLSFNLKLFRQKGKTFSFDIYMKYMLFSFKSYYLIVNSFHIINQTKQMLNKWF